MERHNGGRRPVFSALALALAALTLGWGVAREAVAQAPLAIKVASLAPEGSVWDGMLRAIDKEFQALSGGAVSLKIYAGGVLGNETQILKKMKIGQIQAAMLTSAGVGDFDQAALTLQTPGVIQTYEELDFVMERLGPVLDQRVVEKGFVCLGWGEAGWARFFTKTKVATPQDLQNIKLYAWEGDPKMVDLYKKVGLHPVVIASTDMLPSLQTGLIDGVPTTALAALSYQWFGIANNMVDLKWSPLIGALVVDAKAWQKVDAALQPQLEAAARRIVAEHKAKIRALDEQAIDVMKKNGLVVNAPADPAAWQTFAESTHPLLRGAVFPADIFDQLMTVHQEYQARGTAPASP